MGPRIVPWGTPDLTWVHEEKVPRTTTRSRHLAQQREKQTTQLSHSQTERA